MNVYVTDKGDPSVGIPSITVATLELDKYMTEALKDDGTMDNFKSDFKALIEKYYEAECSYDVYDDEDLRLEAEYEEEAWKAWNKNKENNYE